MKPKLFIIHGWAYSIEPWTETVRILRTAGIDVVQLKVPGLTMSSSDTYTIDDYVEWLHNQLAQEIVKPMVLGHSNGGRIAMHYLQKYPESFRQLILLDSAGIETSARRLSLKRRIIGFAAKILKPLKYIPFVSKIAYRVIGSDYGAAPKNMQLTLANMLASDSGFSPSFINIPTAILWGANDDVTPTAMAQKLNTEITDSSLKIINGWGHAPYRTHPSELAHEINSIIESIK